MMVPSPVQHQPTQQLLPQQQSQAYIAAVVFRVSTSRTTNLFITTLLSHSGAVIATDRVVSEKTAAP
jgi:hypothetical protein